MPRNKNTANNPADKLRGFKFRYKIGFEAYGVKIGLSSNSKRYLNKIQSKLGELFPEGWRDVEFSETAHRFSINFTKTDADNFIYKNDELILSGGNWSYDAPEPYLRLTVAEFAEKCIFLHAGAVAYKGKGIIIPGKSFAGKSTLVAELSKRGMLYFSDEYAVIDFEGRLHPFAKKVSMRGIVDDYTQVDIPIEEMGGRKGCKPVKIGLLLIAAYKKGAKFKPKKLTAGEGIIEAISNSVSIRRNPSEVLQTLNKVIINAEAVKTSRGEASDFAEKLIEYLDNKF